MEGRDIGTVVFPDAKVKIFLDAAPEVRGLRRFDQLGRLGPAPATQPDEVIRELRLRDERDRNRADSPLKPAPDAVLLDSTEMTLEEAVEAAEAIVTRSCTQSIPTPDPQDEARRGSTPCEGSGSRDRIGQLAAASSFHEMAGRKSVPPFAYSFHTLAHNRTCESVLGNCMTPADRSSSPGLHSATAASQPHASKTVRLIERNCYRNGVPSPWGKCGGLAVAANAGTKPEIRQAIVRRNAIRS